MELDPKDVEIGLSAASPELLALRLIGKTLDGRMCERSTAPLPYGCWEEDGRSPYALYSDERWCDACIAYAGLNRFLPRPVLTIEGRAEPEMSD